MAALTLLAVARKSVLDDGLGEMLIMWRESNTYFSIYFKSYYIKFR